MHATLSTLFTPEQKERLAAAVRIRTSCRSLDGAPTMAEQAALAYHAGRFALPGARLALLPADASAFPTPMGGSPGITGCALVAAVITQGDSWRSRLNAGIIGEALVLEATAMGLGTCWVGGSVRRSAFTSVLTSGEALQCIIALGKPVTPLTAPPSRRRKPPEQLCMGGWQDWPEQLIRAATLVHQAPSGMNQQPWSLHLLPDGSFALDALPRYALDAGIALCHAELALDTPHTWRFSDAPEAPLATAAAQP